LKKKFRKKLRGGGYSIKGHFKKKIPKKFLIFQNKGSIFAKNTIKWIK